MKPVYQTIIGMEHGNCMQAAIASLFELPLEDVPNFRELDDPNHHLMQFGLDKKYELVGTIYNTGVKTIDRLKDDDIVGINGYFYAVVYSPKFYDEFKGKHAVIIDKNYNIVHDPNPDNKGITKYPEADKLGYNGILYVIVLNEKHA